MILIYILIVLALVQGCVSLGDGLRNTRYVRSYRKPEGGMGPVVVFCPVKGADHDLEANARSLLGQRFHDYRVVFLVDTPGDPAAGVLRSIDGAEVAVGGYSAGRSQKVHNLLGGIARFGTDADVFVFADADARFPPEWLEQLVAPLGAKRVGATTGYRWYIPEPGNPASLVRSAWNATVAGYLGPHRNNFVWGGSTAIRRAVFFEAGIDRLWEKAVSDDYALTYGVRRHGLGIEYVPPCLVPAFEGCTWRGLIEFTTRQIRITRVYAPEVWRMGIATTTLFNLAFLPTTALVLAGRLGFLLPWLALYGLTVVRSEVRLRGVRLLIQHPSLRTHRWFYRLSAPLVSLLYQINFALSLLSRRIVWKGVAYTMLSPTETRVEFPDAS